VPRTRGMKNASTHAIALAAAEQEAAAVGADAPTARARAARAAAVQLGPDGLEVAADSAAKRAAEAVGGDAPAAPQRPPARTSEGSSKPGGAESAAPPADAKLRKQARGAAGGLASGARGVGRRTWFRRKVVPCPGDQEIASAGAVGA